MQLPRDLMDEAKRQRHRVLLEIDDDYRFECACCGEQAAYERYSWIDLEARIRAKQSYINYGSFAADMAAQIDEDVVQSFIREGK